MDRKYIKQSHWNHIALACSEDFLQGLCHLYANFQISANDHGYLDPSIFNENSVTYLMIPPSNNLFKYAFIKAWNTVPGGSLANVGTELQKGCLSTDAKSSAFLRVSYPLLNGDIVDHVTGNKLSSLEDAQFSYYWVPTDFDNLGVGELKDQCVEFANQQTSLSLSFQSQFPEGFTVRFWYKLLTWPAGSDAALLDHSSNFQIRKEQDSDYKVIQQFTDPSYPASFQTLTISSSLTVQFWDIVMYKLDKVGLTLSGKTYAQPLNQHSLTLQSRSIDWSGNLPYSSTLVVGDSGSSLCLRQLAFLSYPVKHSEFKSPSLFFSRPLTIHSEGIVLFMSPQHYTYSSIRSDLSDDQIFFSSPSSIIALDQPKVMTIQNGATAALFPVFSRTLSHFTIMVLFKISPGSISSNPVNIISFANQLQVTHVATTDVQFKVSCSVSATFTSPTIQNDWTALSVTYTGSKLKLQRLGDITESACSGETFSLSGNIDLNQGTTGVFISYSYIYIFSEWLTPGEILFYSFKKLPLHYSESVLATGYSFTYQPRTHEPYFITDLSGSLSVSLLAQTGMEWDYTRQLNGGSAPSLTQQNAELQLCEEGQLWSRGGACYPSTRAYPIKFSSTSVSFSFAGVTQFSFAFWFQSDNPNHNGAVLYFLNGVCRVNIVSGTPKVQYKAPSTSMTLQHTYSLNEWHQVGGTMTTSMAQFFKDNDYLDFTPGLSFTTLNVTPFQSLSGSDPINDNFYIYFISMWSSKLPLLTLRQAVGGRVLERDSALLHLSFNFQYASKIWDWLELTRSITLDTNNIEVYTLTSDDLLAWVQTCSLGSYSIGSQCVTSPGFLCFTAAQSAQTSPLDASSLGIDVYDHSILLWFSITQTASGIGSLDIKFGESGFHISITQNAQLSLSLGSTPIIATTSINGLNTWHLVKASVNNNQALSASVQLSDGTFLIQDAWITNIAIPASITMTLFSIESSLSGGRVCVAMATLYPLSMPNQLSIQFSSNPFNLADPANPVFLYEFKYQKVPFKERSSANSLQISESAFQFSFVTPDPVGDQILHCLFQDKSFNTQTSQCQSVTTPTCANPNSLSCSSSGINLVCDTGFVNKQGSCTLQCGAGQTLVSNFCFNSDLLREYSYSITLNSDNSFVINFDAPLLQGEYDEIKEYISITVAGTTYSSDSLSLNPIYTNSEITALEVDWSLDLTVRSKDEVALNVQFQGENVSGKQSNQILLNPQQNPEFVEQIRSLNSIVDAVSPTVQSATAFSLLQALISDGVLKYLWGVINASQLMALLPLIDVPVPPNVMIVFQFMAIANGDFQFLKSLPNFFRELHIFNINTLEEQKPLNLNFQFCGYESGSFFILQELKILLFLLYLAFILPVILITLLLSCISKWKRLFRFFNLDFWIRFILQLFLELFLCILIALHSVFSHPSKYRVDVILTSLSFGLLLVFSLTVSLCLCTRQASITQRSKKWRGKVLTEEISVKHKGRRALLSLIFYPLFLAQRAGYCLILVFLRSYPLWAALLCLLLFILGALYVVAVQPFSSKFQNVLEFCSQGCMVILFGFMIFIYFRANSITERTLMNLGYGMIALILLNILVNLLTLFITSLLSLIQFCRRKKKIHAQPHFELQSVGSLNRTAQIHQTSEVADTEVAIQNISVLSLKRRRSFTVAS